MIWLFHTLNTHPKESIYDQTFWTLSISKICFFSLDIKLKTTKKTRPTNWKTKHNNQSSI
jgi:hypothetical protein